MTTLKSTSRQATPPEVEQSIIDLEFSLIISGFEFDAPQRHDVRNADDGDGGWTCQSCTTRNSRNDATCTGCGK
ncbi:hypothetical protein BJF79_32355 [Actinomadura sp. CNU-125]|uniref:hypothetical protein n=1 Tax=Actinomadura sp. CNU-125 TaxID=1904961 RepID=UPI000967711C|nr:hypothetical protein [Actinomadura sp. CNU-125]OLT35452.1 hypothetical protein BJF79_32355 [Actinomadura sp. CNU-125]